MLSQLFPAEKYASGLKKSVSLGFFSKSTMETLLKRYSCGSKFDISKEI